MGRAEQLLEPVRARAAAWGRKEKIPPPSLSTTTSVQVDAAPPAARAGRPVVQEGEVADQRDAVGARRHGTGRGRPRPSGGGRAPRRCRWRPGWRAPAGRPGARPYHSTSRTGIDDDTTSVAPSGRAATRARATPGSVGSGVAVEHGVDGRLGGLLGPAHRSQPGPRRLATGAAGQSQAQRWSDRRRAPGGPMRSGSIHGAVGVDQHLLGVRGRPATASTFDAHGRAEAQHDLGARGRRPRSADAQEGVGGRDRRRAGARGTRTGGRPAPASRGRRRPRCTAGRRPPRPRRPRSRLADPPVEQPRRPASAGGSDGAAADGAHGATDAPPAPAGGHVAGRAEQRLAERRG